MIAIVVGALQGVPAWALRDETTAMADGRTGTPSPDNKNANAPVVGADTVGSLRILVNPRPLPHVLSVTVEPIVVNRSEPYLVLVSGRSRPEEQEAQIGSFSFFPPPRPGEARTFFFPIVSTLAQAAAETGVLMISVRLVPAAAEVILSSSQLRVLEAHVMSQ